MKQEALAVEGVLCKSAIGQRYRNSRQNQAQNRSRVQVMNKQGIRGKAESKTQINSSYHSDYTQHQRWILYLSVLFLLHHSKVPTILFIQLINEQKVLLLILFMLMRKDRPFIATIA